MNNVEYVIIIRGNLYMHDIIRKRIVESLINLAKKNLVPGIVETLYKYISRQSGEKDKHVVPRIDERRKEKKLLCFPSNKL